MWRAVDMCRKTSMLSTKESLTYKSWSSKCMNRCFKEEEEEEEEEEIDRWAHI